VASDHQTLPGLFSNRKQKPGPWRSAAGVAAVIVLIATGVAITRLRDTYGDWDDVVLGSRWTLVFVGISLVATVAALAFVTFVVKPKRWIPYALVVTFGIQTFIATPLDLSPLNDADTPDESSTVNLNSALGFAEPMVTKRLDRLVEKKRKEERNSFVNSYAKGGKAGKASLLRGLDNAIDDETGIKTGADKDAIKKQLRMIIEDRKSRPDFVPRLDTVVTTLYDKGLRDVVQDLAVKK